MFFRRFSVSKAIFAMTLANCDNYDEKMSFMTAGGLNTESLSMETQKVKLREKMTQKIIKEKEVLKEVDETIIESEKSSDDEDEDEDDFDDKYENQTASTVTIILIDSCVSNAKKLSADTR